MCKKQNIRNIHISVPNCTNTHCFKDFALTFTGVPFYSYLYLGYAAVVIMTEILCYLPTEIQI